jgi:hypothetical protein
MELVYLVNFPNDREIVVESDIASELKYFIDARTCVNEGRIVATSQWSRSAFEYMRGIILLGYVNIPEFSLELGVELLFTMNFFGVSNRLHTAVVKEFACLLIQEIQEKDPERLRHISPAVDKIPEAWLDEILSPIYFNMRYFPYLAKCEGKLRDVALARNKLWFSGPR